MNRGVDASPADRLAPRTGATTGGVPLAFNREPDPRLRDWVSRSMVAVAEGPADVTLEGYLCNDASYLRSAVDVDWIAMSREGPVPVRDRTILCGQHTRSWKLEYRGGIKVAGLMLRPGALRSLFGLDEKANADCIRMIEETGIPDAEVTGLYRAGMERADWLQSLEDWFADFIACKAVAPPDPLAQAIELQAFADPNIRLDDFAERVGVSPKQVQRVAQRDFGMTPKQVFRRARILDLAARICGVADEEEEEILLRFFDQAHQIKEFQTFFGVTPGAFKRTRSNLLTLSLEIRQARRLELLERIEPGALRPWMREPILHAAA